MKYQFGDSKISEDAMARWCKINDIIELIVFILSRFILLDFWGKIGLAVFYITSTIILMLQFTFAEFGLRRKILDILWIVFYVVLFLYDICDISVLQKVFSTENIELANNIDSFLSNTIVGKIIVGAVTPILRGVLITILDFREKE